MARGIGIEAIGIERVVAEILPSPSMQGVGAGLDSKALDAAGGVAELRRVGVGVNPELLHGIQAGNIARRVGIIVDGIGCPVDSDFRLAALRTIDVEGIGGALGGKRSSRRSESCFA